MKTTLTALLLVLASPAFASETMTVDQAVKAAIEHNANVKNARIEVESAQTRIDAARTQRLPSLKLDMIGGEALSNLSIIIKEDKAGRDTRIDLARTFNMIGVAQITQPITQLHKINLGVQLNEVSRAIDKEHERAARIAVTREVKSAYFNVLSAKSYAAATAEAVTAWEEAEREMVVRVSQKAALESDRMDASAHLASTKLAALSAENTLATAQDQLNYLVGSDVEVVEPSFSEPVKASKIDVSRRPDVREAELTLEKAKLGVRIKNADRIPDVALMVSSSTPFNNDVLPRNMTSAGITMSYEPFTWGRRGAEISERRHAVEQAQNALDDKRAAAGVEVAARLRKVEESAAQITVRRLESESAREKLRVTKAKFHELAARADEMYGASASLTNAAAREQEAISAYWTALADYEKAIGEE